MENDALLIQIRVRDAKQESLVQGPILCLTIQRTVKKQYDMSNICFENPTI